MALYSFIGVAVTSATMVIFGEAIWDPVVLLTKFDSPWCWLVPCSRVSGHAGHQPGRQCGEPATNDSPTCGRAKSAFRIGGLITGMIGILMHAVEAGGRSHRLHLHLADRLLRAAGPIGGILVCDYFILRSARLDLAGLYDARGGYAVPGRIQSARPYRAGAGRGAQRARAS
jgi:NCS1 family nucleobase:cation symporter-1